MSLSALGDHVENDPYTRAMLHRKEGYALYLPTPPNDLPESARRVGTEIGDVVLVTDQGSIDPVFNILRPANDRANQRFGVPPAFEQVVLPDDDIRTQVPSHSPGCVISNTTVKRKHLERNGLLILPDGASSWDARSRGIFHECAMKHGREWYAWINRERKREVKNGSMYLVTGVTKSTSWCIAAGNDSSGDRKVSLKLKAAPVGLFCPFWPHHLPGEESWRDNQTVFFRGYKITVPQTPLLKPQVLWISDEKNERKS
ncbi:hypothetical protein B0H13DRAFT_2100981 [Mycena leptocephala]|nr:hypothetical protein B0H13DRAFT_2100981 [Mycena leptocephala]